MDKQTLEISEYVALAGSALGSVVAAVSGQALFAAAPLTLALSLNLANRRRVDQEIQQYTTEALTQAYQVVQSLQQEVQALPAINRRLSDLDQQFYTRPETQSIGALEGAITQLKEQLNEMATRLAQPSTSPDTDLGGVEQAISYINSQLEDLTLRFDQLPTTTGFDLPEIEQTIAYINSQLETLSFRLDQVSTPQEADLSGVEQAFADIQGQLNAVTQRLDEVAIPQAIDLGGIEQMIGEFQGQLEALNQQFNSRPELQGLEQSQNAIAQLSEQLEAITFHLNNAPTAPEVDLSGVEQAIADIQGQLNAVTRRLDEVAIPQAIDLGGMEQVIGEFQGQLEALNQQFNSRPELQGLEQSQNAIAQLSEQIEAITQRLDQAPTLQPADISGLEWAILDINRQLDALNQQFNTRPETQAIEESQSAITRLSEQLEAVTQRLDHLPTASEPDLSAVEQEIATIQGQLRALTLLLDHSSTPQAVDLSGVEQAIANIQGQLEELKQQFNTRPELQAIEQSETAITRLTEQLLTLRLDSTSAPQSVDLTGVEQTITTLQGQIESLNQQFNTRPEAQTIEQLEGAIAQLAEYIETLAQRVDGTSAPQVVDLSGVEQTIATLQGQLESLNQQFNTRPEAQAIEQSQAAITKLSEQLESVTLRLETIPTAPVVDLTGFEQSIATTQSQIESLNQQFSTRPETQTIEQLEGAIAQLAEYLEALSQRVDGTSAPQAAVDFTAFEEAILELSVQLDSLKQRVDDLSTPQAVQPREEEIASRNSLGQEDIIASPFEELPLSTLFEELPLPVSETVKPIGQEVASTDIPGPLGELIQRFQERPETQAIKQIETTIEQLTEQLVAVALRLGQFKSASDVNVSGLKQAIADTQGKMDVLYQQFKARPETQAIEQLESAIAQFGEIDLNGDEEAVEDFNFQVDAMSLCLENLPAPLPFDLDGVGQAMANLDSELKALNSLKNGAVASSVDPWDDAKAQNLEPLATAIIQLQEELKASIAYLENLPDPQGADLWGDEDEIANLQW